MPNPVSLVTIHHEGAGVPSDVPRGREGGYTYWIGATYWTWLRDVWSSYATLNYNGDSLDICLSGNRMESDVSSKDIEIIRGAYLNARSRGYVIDSPLVRAHKNSPGSSTVCPGDQTMEVWNQVVAACTYSSAPPKPPEPEPEPTPEGEDLMLADTCKAKDPKRPGNQTPTLVFDPANRKFLSYYGASVFWDVNNSTAARHGNSDPYSVNIPGDKTPVIAVKFFPNLNADGSRDLIAFGIQGAQWSGHMHDVS